MPESPYYADGVIVSNLTAAGDVSGGWTVFLLAIERGKGKYDSKASERLHAESLQRPLRQDTRNNLLIEPFGGSHCVPSEGSEDGVHRTVFRWTGCG